MLKPYTVAFQPKCPVCGCIQICGCKACIVNRKRSKTPEPPFTFKWITDNAIICGACHHTMGADEWEEEEERQLQEWRLVLNINQQGRQQKRFINSLIKQIDELKQSLGYL